MMRVTKVTAAGLAMSAMTVTRVAVAGVTADALMLVTGVYVSGSALPQMQVTKITIAGAPSSGLAASVSSATVLAESGSPLSLIGSDTGAVSRKWTIDGITLSSTNEADIVLPTLIDDAIRRYIYTVTDSGGATASATVDVTILRSTIQQKQADGSWIGFVIRKIGVTNSLAPTTSLTPSPTLTTQA